jgi:hypothetical protein
MPMTMPGRVLAVTALGALALLLTACLGVPKRALIPIPPERAGAWTRLGLETLAPGEAPEPLRAAAPTAWIRAAYFREGLGVQVNVYGFDRAPALRSAIEAIEREQDEEAVHFERPSMLVVCTSESADRDTLEIFARELEAAWLPARR